MIDRNGLRIKGSPGQLAWRNPFAAGRARGRLDKTGPAPSLLLIITLLLLPTLASCATQPPDLVHYGSYGIQEASHGTVLAAHNLHTPFIPASVTKVVTSLAALEILGDDFHFQTKFYLTKPGPDLWVKGGGDPLLISEAMAEIAAAFQKKGLKQLRHIYLDDSFFGLEQVTVSSSNSNNPYDASLNALGANFTTINVQVNKDGSISSAEEQTPFLSLMHELGSVLPPGVHRINVGRNRQTILRHTGELLTAKLAQVGIKVTGESQPGLVPNNATPLYTHPSPDLHKLLKAMLLYSNNYTANSLFLACGVKEYGPPATWAKARNALSNFLSKKGLNSPQIIIIDGAGLSTKNRLTASFMLEVLHHFRPHRHLLPRHKQALVKSGTMTGVYSYAGFLSENAKAPAVIIILNQARNNREKLLELLQKKYR
ncbi:MAG: D-alanyl-D-alanine carboxypeptidase [Thermodesulfobacteriota bacterium]